MRNFHFTRIVKTALIGIFILAVTIIIINFVRQTGSRSQIKDRSGEMLEQKIARQERIEHLEITKGLKENFRISADKYYQGEDGRFYIEGNIHIISLNKSEGEDILISGKKAVYDQELTDFMISEDVLVLFKDLEIKAPLLRFDAETQTFLADREVSFHSPRLKGKAEKLILRLKEWHITLLNDVSIELNHGLESSFPLEIEAQRIDYRRQNRVGKVQGNIKLSHGNSMAVADKVEFHLFFEENKLKDLLLEGNVKAEFSGERERIKTQSTRVFPFYQDKQQVEAQELLIQIYQDVSHVKKIQASGESRISFLSGTKGNTDVEAETIEFLITTKGDLKHFSAKDGARIQETDKNGKMRILSGDVLFLTKKNEVLVSQGTKDIPSKLTTEDAEILAGEITLNLGKNNVRAGKTVKAILNPSGMENKVGFFSDDEPVFITAGEMTHTARRQYFQFKKNVKVWQSAESLATQALILNKKTGRVECEEEIRAVFLLESEGEEEKKVELSAEKMNFNPKKNVMTFDTDALLKMDDFSIKAGMLIMRFDQEKQMVSSITARGEVVIQQPNRKGQGNVAFFDVMNERIVLSGDPVVEDEERGIIRGDKLTFDLAGDRIIVENQGRERSKTVIKS